MNGAEVIADRLELVSPHARGSMSEVHRGRDLQTGDTVAVKLIWRRGTGEEVSLTPQMASSGCTAWAPGHWHRWQVTSARPGRAHSCPFPHRPGKASQTTARPHDD